MSIRTKLKDLYREGHYQGQKLDTPLNFEEVDKTISEIKREIKAKLPKKKEKKKEYLCSIDNGNGVRCPKGKTCSNCKYSEDWGVGYESVR